MAAKLSKDINFISIAQRKLNGGLADTGNPQDIGNDESPCTYNMELGEYGGIRQREWVLEKVGDNTGIGGVLALFQIEVHDRCGHRHDGVGMCENGDVVKEGETCSDGSTPLDQQPCPFESCRDVILPSPKGTGKMVLIRAVEDTSSDGKEITVIQYFIPATDNLKEGVWQDIVGVDQKRFIMNGHHFFKMVSDGPILWVSNEETNLFWICCKENPDSPCEPIFSFGEPTCASEYRNNGQPTVTIESTLTNISNEALPMGHLVVTPSLVGCEDDWQALVKYVQTNPRFLGTEYRYQACPKLSSKPQPIPKDWLEKACVTRTSKQIIGGDKEIKLSQEQIDNWMKENKKWDGEQGGGDDGSGPWDLAFVEKYMIPNPKKAKIFVWLCYQEQHDKCTNWEIGDDGNVKDPESYKMKSNSFALSDIEIPECLDKTVYWYPPDEHTADQEMPNVPPGAFYKFAITWNEVDKEKGGDINDPNTKKWCPRYCCKDDERLTPEDEGAIRTNFLTSYGHRLFAVRDSQLIYGTKSISSSSETLFPSGMGDFLNRGTLRQTPDMGITYIEDKSAWVTNFTVFDGKPKLHLYSPSGPKIMSVEYNPPNGNLAGDFQLREIISSNASNFIYGATKEGSIDYFISSFYGANELDAFGIFQGFPSESTKIQSGKIKRTMANLDMDRVALTTFSGLLIASARKKEDGEDGCVLDDFDVACLRFEYNDLNASLSNKGSGYIIGDELTTTTEPKFTLVVNSVATENLYEYNHSLVHRGTGYEVGDSLTLGVFTVVVTRVSATNTYSYTLTLTDPGEGYQVDDQLTAPSFSLLVESVDADGKILTFSYSPLQGSLSIAQTDEPLTGGSGSGATISVASTLASNSGTILDYTVTPLEGDTIASHTNAPLIGGSGTGATMTITSNQLTQVGSILGFTYSPRVNNSNLEINNATLTGGSGTGAMLDISSTPHYRRPKLPRPNNMLLTYNIGLDAWMPWGPLYISCFHEFKEKGAYGSVKQRIIAGDPRFHQTYQFVKGMRDYTTASRAQSSYISPEAYWESKQLNLEEPIKGKRIKGLVINGYIGPGAEATVGIKLDCQDSSKLAKRFSFDSVKGCNSGAQQNKNFLGCQSCSSVNGARSFSFIIDLAQPEKFMTVSVYLKRSGGQFEISNYALLLQKTTEAEAWEIARSASNISFIGAEEEYYVNGYPDF